MIAIKAPKRVNLKGAPTDKYIWHRQDARAYLVYLVLKELGSEHEGGALGISKKLNLKTALFNQYIYHLLVNNLAEWKFKRIGDGKKKRVLLIKADHVKVVSTNPMIRTNLLDIVVDLENPFWINSIVDQIEKKEMENLHRLSSSRSYKDSDKDFKSSVSKAIHKISYYTKSVIVKRIGNTRYKKLVNNKFLKDAFVCIELTKLNIDYAISFVKEQRALYLQRKKNLFAYIIENKFVIRLGKTKNNFATYTQELFIGFMNELTERRKIKLLDNV